MGILMDSAELIQKVHEAGAEISLAGDKVNVLHASRLPTDLRRQLQKDRDGIVRCLSRMPMDIEGDQFLSNFLRLVAHIGTDSQVKLEDSEILSELDADGIEELKQASRETRIAWATAIGLRLIRHREIVPMDWNKIAHCKHCGPVYSFHDHDTLSCGWCDMRLAGKWFPVPDD